MMINLKDPVLFRGLDLGADHMKLVSLTLDEFYILNPYLLVERTLSNCKSRDEIAIESACRKIREPNTSSKSASNFTLSISNDTALDQEIPTPYLIARQSLFELFWTKKEASVFFRERNKRFYAIQKRFVSWPYKPYGGLSEWLYIYSGELTITLFPPTKLNKSIYFSYDEEDKARFENETVFNLEPGDTLLIPPGWISIREAKSTVFAFGGEYLRQYDLGVQLNEFEEDVVESDSRFSHSIDCEIRTLYWFLAMNYKNPYSRVPRKNETQVQMDSKDLERAESTDQLKLKLAEWRVKARRIQLGKDCLKSSNIYVPYGICDEQIVKALQKFKKPALLDESIQSAC